MGDRLALDLNMNVDFSDRKLSKEAASTLMSQPVESLEPLVPMMAPVYVYLKLNEKFVLVKHPLDFFLKGELDRLASYQEFYVPRESSETARFQKVARVARSILTWKPGRSGPSDGLAAEGLLQPASFEVSDALLRILAPLWVARDPDKEEGAAIDSLGVTLFVSELCDRIPGEKLLAARELDVRSYFRALCCSSWAVFLGMHLGYCDLGYLNRLRLGAFEPETGDVLDPGPLAGSASEPGEIIRLARQLLPEPPPVLPGMLVQARQMTRTATGRTSSKLAARLDRLEKLAYA